MAAAALALVELSAEEIAARELAPATQAHEGRCPAR